MIEYTKPQKYLKTFFLTILLLGMIISVYERQFMNAVLILGIIILSGLPAYFAHRYSLVLPADFELMAIIFNFAAIYLGTVQGYFLRFWWWDLLLHASSGFLLGILGFLLVWTLNHHYRIELSLNPAFIALFSFSFSLALGTLWEIYEFGMDSLFGLNMQKSGLVDTMWDLIVDAVGGGIMAWLGYLYLRHGKETFIIPLIRKFIRKNRSFIRRSKE
jgi:hypothetical protein